jgi:DNA repair exonuclease SbcCD ATPase subunit
MKVESAGEPAAPTGSDEVVPVDEREEILREIENNIRVSREALVQEGTSGSRGLLLPAAVNIGALVLLAAAVLFVPRLFDISERRLVDPETANSAEAAGLFKALRQEADEQLQEQQAAIESLQQQYGKVRDEREALRRDFDSRLKEKSDALQDELKLALETERQKLNASGLADAAAEAKLRELETRLQAERTATIEAYSARLQSESAERERQLAASQSRFSEELRQKTDPLAAEIEKLRAQGKLQQAAQEDLARRYEAARTEITALQSGHVQEVEALRRDMQELTRRHNEEQAALRRDLQESRKAADSLQARLQSAEASRAALRDRLEAMARRYGATGSPSKEKESERAARIELLAAKVEVRELLASEPLKSTHPGLAEKLDAFFLESEETYRAEGMRKGFAEASGIVDSLAAARTPPASTAGALELQRFLESLRQLLK